MTKIAPICKVTLAIAALTAMGLSAAAGQTAGAPSAVPKGYECHDQALTGSGAGFKSSQEESEEAAKVNWLEKAKQIYADAYWETAKDSGIQCVKQGLYSKCFANGFPCHPKASD
jgi:hypothetical protein